MQFYFINPQRQLAQRTFCKDALQYTHQSLDGENKNTKQIQTYDLKQWEQKPQPEPQKMDHSVGLVDMPWVLHIQHGS